MKGAQRETFDENSFVNAAQIHKGKVLCSDKKKLGVIVNIIIDLEMDLAARLLIFPQEKPWWVVWLTEKGQDITIDLVKQAFPEDTDKILTDIADKGSDAALDLWKERLKHRNCYLVPLHEVKNIEGQCVNLKSSLDQIASCYDDLSTNEGEIALYPEDALSTEENKTLLPITLNLPKLKGNKVSDQEGHKGRIFNIELDAKKGQVANIIVAANAGNHVVSAEDFDWSTFESKANIETAPLLTSLPKKMEKPKMGIFA
jgi:sporulation protein YlmC with PRC-barrel domain